MNDEQGGGAMRRLADRRAVLRNVAGLSMLPLGAGLLSGCDGEGDANIAATGAVEDASSLAAAKIPAATTSFTVAVLLDTQ